jgi:hypothetical protein
VKETDHQENLYLHGRKYKLILEKYNVVWTGFIWLRVEASGGLL